MAANLNTPSHFSNTIAGGSTTPVLLPPSTFETSKPAVDPWQALAKATGEILNLKQENNKLKETKHISFPVGEELKARVDLHQHDRSSAPAAAQPDHTQFNNYHDIINRQAADVASLQKQLSQSVSDCERQVAKMESQMVLRDSQNVHKLRILEEKLKAMEKLYEEEKSKVQSVQEKWDYEHRDIVGQWRDQLEASERRRADDVAGLEQQLGDTERHLQDTEAELTGQIKKYQNTVKEQEQMISQMKTYLSETENNTKSTEIWKKDVANLKQIIKDKEAEKGKLESDSDLLKIRLKSQNEMLSIQEKELSKVIDASSEKKRQCLLTRWREKVYQLLVQLRCAEIVHLDQERQWKGNMINVQKDLETMTAQWSLLQCALQDKQAQLDMEKNTVKTLQDELVRAQQVAIELDDRSQCDKQTIQELIIHITRLTDTLAHVESTHTKTLSMLSAHNQRISYASGRVELLQGLFARKEAHMRLEMEQRLNEKPTRDTEEADDTAKSALNQARSELEKVTAERDALASQIKSDARLLEKKVLSAKEQVAEEVSSLQERLQQLHEEYESKLKLCGDQQSALEEKDTELEEATESIDSLKIQLAKAQLSSEQAIETTLAEAKANFTEQLASLEHKLNEARREHTKAVVSIRQQERQVSREKDRSAQHVQTLENYYKTELSKMENQWKSAEKDKNLLMATLRQEGLIGKYKSQRRSPVNLTEDTVPGATGDLSQRSLVGEAPVRDRSDRSEPEDFPTQAYMASAVDSDEPLHAIIDDLKALTQVVMGDDAASVTMETGDGLEYTEASDLIQRASDTPEHD